MLENITIRKALLDDLPHINDIYNYSVLTSFSVWRWDIRSYDDAKKWFSRHDSNHHCIYVALLKNKIVGYGALSSFRNIEGYNNVVENSVYVHKDFRRKRIGSALMTTLIQVARECELWVISAWIDSGNIESIRLHENFNFYTVGDMKDIGEKFSKKRSVTIMHLDLR